MELSTLSNTDVLKGVLQALYTVTSRRTTQSFAVAVIGTITKTLEEKYEFLKHVRISSLDDSEDIIDIDSAIDSVPSIMVGNAVKAIVQVVYMDLKKNAGLYFITELRRNAGVDVTSALRDVGIDLELLQLQQHYLYRQPRRIKAKSSAAGRDVYKTQHEEKSLLNFSWENVSSWKYDVDSRSCIVYGKEGNVLDHLNLDEIVEGYICSLTGAESFELSTDYNRENKGKCLKLEKKYEKNNDCGR